MLDPRPRMTSARPPEIAFSVEYRWNTRTGSSELRTVTAEADSFGAGRDRGEHHVAGRHREVLGVMLANPEEVHAGVFGEDALFDHVANCLGVRGRLAVGVAVAVAEGVQPEGVRHVRLLVS